MPDSSVGQLGVPHVLRNQGPTERVLRTHSMRTRLVCDHCGRTLTDLKYDQSPCRG